MKNSTLFLLIMTGVIATTHAQTGNPGYFRRGEQLYQAGEYEAAAQYYERYLSDTKRSRVHGQPLAMQKKVHGRNNVDPLQESVYHLADCYRSEHDYLRAEPLYKKATAFPAGAYPEARYWYAVTLRTNGKYKEAEEQLNQFEKEYTAMGPVLHDADRELASLRYIQTQLKKNPAPYQLVRQDNGEMTSAYAAAVKGDTVVFTGIHTERDTHKDPNVRNDLFETPATSGDSNLLAGAQLMKFVYDAGGHTGLASFPADGRTMYFTRWTKQNGKTISAIWSTHLSDSGWSRPVAMETPVNREGYNSTQPFVTMDGRYLLFASDRPGGQGKYDLWFADLDSTGRIVRVANMGDKINTPGDEEAPYFHSSSRTLVFSSNGRVGLGGFDLYYTQGIIDLSRWTTPVNPGMPLNSSRDDIYFISTDEDNIWNTGWLSSDRETNCCLALYTVRQDNHQVITGRIVDAQTHIPLVDAALTLTDPRHPDRVLGAGHSDSLGRYRFELKNTSRMALRAQKETYQPGDDTYVIHMETGSDTLDNGDLALQPIAKPTPVAPEQGTNTIGNFPYKRSSLPKSAKDRLDSLANLLKADPRIDLDILGYTDGVGGDMYNLRLAQKRVDACIDYLVKKGISRSRLHGKAMGECCPLEPDMIAGKDNPAGREVNRRVEYRVIRE